MAKRKDDEMVDVTELVLQPTQAKVRKPRKALGDMTVQERLDSPTLSQRLLGHFMLHYERKWGFKYFLVLDTKTKSPRRDLKALGDLGEQWGENVVKALIELFFTTTDPQVVRCRSYNAMDFQFLAPRLRMAQVGGTGGSMNDKTASNIHEISKAMGRKP